MTYKHLIVRYNDEEILILFLDYNYEFSKFNKPIKSSLVKYIKDNKIFFNGTKVLLTIGGFIVASFLYYNNNLTFEKFDNNTVYDYTSSFSNFYNIPKAILNIENKNNVIEVKSEKKSIKESKPKDIKKNQIKSNIEAKKNTIKNTNLSTPKKNNKEVTKEKIKITIYRSDGNINVLELEDYVLGVVAAEMPASFNLEALKVQAIIARTYALKSLKTGKKLTDTVATQAYIDTDGMKKKWGSEFSKYYTKIKNAVNLTNGLYITYDNNIIDAVYYSTSNGYTEDSIEVWGYSVPYLKSVSSLWDKDTTPYERTISINISDVAKNLEVSNIDGVKILKRNSSGRVSLVQIGDNTYTGVDLRNLLSLRSTDFDIEVSKDKLIITTRGYGHGVGLSQYGANVLANKGYTYEKIIKYYYTGVRLSKI